uniref:uncharacterized protein n=1 Tax=Semicossyphus pulcher TaxID=241346 RepID=UPI0037E98C3A
MDFHWRQRDASLMGSRDVQSTVSPLSGPALNTGPGIGIHRCRNWETAPVSSVQLVSECLSHGEKRVSCSSEGGDSPQYSWTLDGNTLTDTQLLSGSKESQIITLKQDVSGRLVCSVRNHIRSVSKEETISTCGYEFFDCTLLNGMHIKQWLLPTDETRCFEPTTTPTRIIKSEVATMGVEAFCDGRQDGAQCYAALGGSVVVQLMDSANETFRYQWKKGSFIILHVRKNRIASNLIESRSSFAPSNGTFTINDLSRNDGGEYTLEIYDDSGTNPVKNTLQLTIQASVSSVQLVSKCLSRGEMRVSCSSEGGDSPQYSLTLGGNTLTDTQLLSGSKESQIITLKQDVSGRLVCSVRNHISRISVCGFMYTDCISSNGMHISHWTLESTNNLCIEPKTNSTTNSDTSVDHSLLVCGLRAAVVTLILIGITVYFVWKKKRVKKAEDSAAPEAMENENTSVMMVEMRSSAAEL